MERRDNPVAFGQQLTWSIHTALRLHARTKRRPSPRSISSGRPRRPTLA
jgi:hypothetical protein